MFTYIYIGGYASFLLPRVTSSQCRLVHASLVSHYLVDPPNLYKTITIIYLLIPFIVKLHFPPFFHREGRTNVTVACLPFEVPPTFKFLRVLQCVFSHFSLFVRSLHLIASSDLEWSSFVPRAAVASLGRGGAARKLIRLRFTLWAATGATSGGSCSRLETQSCGASQCHADNRMPAVFTWLRSFFAHPFVMWETESKRETESVVIVCRHTFQPLVYKEICERRQFQEFIYLFIYSDWYTFITIV